MKSVCLGIGSNIEPQKNIPSAIKLLRRHFTVLKFSSVYETDPVGPSGQAKFWNLAAIVETDLNRKALKASLRKLEKKLGRVRKTGQRFAPSTIDLDILPETLTPAHHRQDFLMIPLAEIAPLAVDSALRKTYRDMAAPLRSKRIRKIFTPE